MMQLVKSGLWAAPWDKQLCQAEKKVEGDLQAKLTLVCPPSKRKQE